MDEKVVEYQISVTDASPEYIEYYPVAEEASDVDNQNLTDVEEFTSLEGEEEVGEEQIDGSSQQKSHLSMQALCALWFKSKVGVQTERNRDFREFELKYTSFVEGICPVFRSCCGVTNIGEDLPKLIEEMTKLGLDNFWPFENAGFQTNVQEMRELFGKILEIVKTCFMFACCERGYVISHADKRFKFSNRWKEEINSRDELVTFQVITNKLIELCESKNWTNGDMSFSNGLKRYFDVLIPALDNFNSEVLAENGISDRMNQIHSRKEIGFAISVEEVDEMLAVSLTMRGFGNFTACAMQCVDIFSTADQLEKILEKSGEMLKTIDIRTGIADESANIFEKCLDNSNNKPEISRILGYPPSEILKRSKNEKAELLKLFYVAHSVDLKERYDFDVPKCLAAIKAFLCAVRCCRCESNDPPDFV
ncbi:unnamed protein product [Caenorhabditis angaria]|uniref:Uncharacterized protein n=1 Tax=Caenorhabditis angaria TaxID=860376 RepID=A0A9P1MS56_9PELO|nr:unnamed protein product [Caenorhabditis angaria]